MKKGRAGCGLVLLSRKGDRWQADVFERHGAGARRVAEVVGSLSCVEKIATEAAPLLAQEGGRSLFVDFLSANRCRIIGPTSARSGPVAGDQPPDGLVELSRESH